MHRQPQGSVPHTQMELVGRQVLCNIFGLPLPAAVATKTNLCSCAAHSNTTSNVHVCVRVCVSSKFYISSIFVSFAGKNAWQKFFKRCQHPSLCLWLDFRCILTLYSPLPLSLSLFNFWHISANTFPTSFSITLMEAQRQKIPKFDFDFGILLNGFIHKLSRLSSFAHLTRFS